MPDDNSPEMPKPEAENPQPESPLMGMFRNWDNLPKGRHITGNETTVESDDPLGQETIVKKLANGFIDHLNKATELEIQIMVKRGIDEKVIDRYKTDSAPRPIFHYFGDDYSYLIHFTTFLGVARYNNVRKLFPEEQFVEIQLIPTLETAQSEEKLRASSVLGAVPVFFEGEDNNWYQAKNSYKLNPHTGKAKKVEEIWLRGDDSWGNYEFNQSELEEIAYVNPNKDILESREVDLSPGDFEQLNSIFQRLESGEITLDPPYLAPK